MGGDSGRSEGAARTAARVLARGGVPVAAGLAFAGQFLVSMRAGSAWTTVLPGLVLYAAALALVAQALRAQLREPPFADSSESVGLAGRRMSTALAICFAVVGGILLLVSLWRSDPWATIALGSGWFALCLALVALAVMAEGRFANAGTAAGAHRTVTRAGAILLAIMILTALYLRLHRIDIIPWGLNNDEAINAIEAEEILAGKPFTTVTERGLNRETMFHQLAAFSLEHPGLGINILRAAPAVFSLNPKFINDPLADRVLPLRMVSIIAGTITVALLFLFARAFFGVRAALFAALFMAVSPWHLLYSRVGLRAILAPAFAIVAAWLFLRAWRSGRMLDHVAWGMTVGLGLWTYTSFRTVPLALAAFTLVLGRRGIRQTMGRGAGSDLSPRRGLLVGAAVAAVFLVIIMTLSGMSPLQFLARGAYATTPPKTQWGLNLLHAVTMTNYYPARYAVIQNDAFISDGVSATFGSIGLEPDTLLLAAFATLGMVVAAVLAWSRPHQNGAVAASTTTDDGSLGRAADAAALSLMMILACWLTVGWLGPSLTRLMVVLPWLTLCSALLAVRVWDDLARLWRPIAGWLSSSAVIPWRTLRGVLFALGLLWLALCGALLAVQVYGALGRWYSPSAWIAAASSLPWYALAGALFSMALFWLALCGVLVIAIPWRTKLARFCRPVTAWFAAAVMAGLLVLVGFQGYWNYFKLAGRSERAMQHFGAPQTIMGMFARSLSPDQDVVILHTLRVDTLRYLVGRRPNLQMFTDTTKVSLEAIVNSPRVVTFVIEYARPFAEPLRALMMRFPQGDMTQVADARIDPDKIIFFTFTIWKDAFGQVAAPPGAAPAPPQGMSTGTPAPPQGMTPGTPSPAPPPGSPPGRPPGS